MANTITSQTLVNGDRQLVVKVFILGDGSGEETDTVIIDASAYAPASTDLKIMQLLDSTQSASACLYWDATVNVPIMGIGINREYKKDFRDFGGLVNNAGAGRTGDILITTSSLGAGDSITLIFYLEKRGIDPTR